MRRTDIIEQAKHIREATQKMGRTATDETALSCPALFDEWTTDTNYVTGDVRKCGETLFRCLQEHTSQESWKPDVSPSLWVRIADPAEEWPQWVQPLGSTDAYEKGAKVSHGGKRWTSDVDGNIWEPGVYGWTEAVE